jgi:hypothetical protein
MIHRHTTLIRLFLNTVREEQPQTIPTPELLQKVIRFLGDQPNRQQLGTAGNTSPFMTRIFNAIDYFGDFDSIFSEY